MSSEAQCRELRDALALMRKAGVYDASPGKLKIDEIVGAGIALSCLDFLVTQMCYEADRAGDTKIAKCYTDVLVIIRSFTGEEMPE